MNNDGNTKTGATTFDLCKNERRQNFAHAFDLRAHDSAIVIAQYRVIQFS